MKTQQRAILYSKLKALGFKGRPSRMQLTRGKVRLQAELERYDKVVIVARGENDSRLHTSSFGQAFKYVASLLKSITKKQPYGGS